MISSFLRTAINIMVKLIGDFIHTMTGLKRTQPRACVARVYLNLIINVYLGLLKVLKDEGTHKNEGTDKSEE